MIDNLKDFKKLLKDCRDFGVSEVEVSGIKIKFGDLSKADSHLIQDQQEVESDNPYANFPDGILTPEQLAYYSSGGLPENDPTPEVQ